MNINFNIRNPYKTQGKSVPDGKTARRMYEMQKSVDKKNKYAWHIDENIDNIAKKCAEHKKGNLVITIHLLHNASTRNEHTFPHVLIKI
jgi:hypothetical protein